VKIFIASLLLGDTDRNARNRIRNALKKHSDHCFAKQIQIQINTVTVIRVNPNSNDNLS
jgi:hypothetical protein